MASIRINVFAPIQTLLSIVMGEVRNPIALIPLFFYNHNHNLDHKSTHWILA